MIKLSNKEFDLFRDYVYQECGINLTPVKRNLLEGRLQKRLLNLNLKSFSEYYTLLNSKKKDSELINMIDAVSTNKTDFFRENTHFEFLKSAIQANNSLRNKTLNIWSAACSTGEEPYTTAMVLQEAIDQSILKDYNITATDISTKALKHCANAVYSIERIADIPQHLRKKYLLKSNDASKNIVRINALLRNKVHLHRLNLMTGDYTWLVNEPQDFIFCRNVLIYFDKSTQKAVVQRLVNCLKPQGYLFIGHSESLFGMDLKLKQI